MANGSGPPDYSLLHKASVSFEYLHTNSTTHVFVFGAIAELVDNARDANAQTLNIDFDESNKYLSFHDDGVGMSPEEMMRVVTFGHSLKKHEHDKIGQYGNGLKSGAMRIAKDFIIFTKKGDFCSALLLSRTFHEDSRLKDILVPTPVLLAESMKPAEPYDINKHKMEMNLIYEYSPFKSQRDFLAQFGKIKGPQGTIVVLFNMRRIENGRFELDFETDKFDIQLTDHERETEEERNSLRAYLAVLYMNPYTKIYLRGKKVNTVRILGTLTNTHYYLYNAKNLKSCAEKEHKNCERRTIEVSDELRQAKSEYGALIQGVREKNGGEITSREVLSQQRQYNMKICDLEALLAECKKKEAEALKAKSKPAPLKFSFGLNIHHRNRYGCMVYNNGRLIDMYVKLSCQKEQKDLYMRCCGVVGVVDISYSILEPTHNKQSFENKREYQHLLKSMNEHMEQYWDDISNVVGRSIDEVSRFWRNLGYDKSLWNSECSRLDADKVKRFQKTNHCIQCDKCLKWRMVPFQRSYVDNGIPDNWSCTNHPNTAARSCATKENFADLVVLKKGTLNPKRKNRKPVEQPIKTTPSSTSLVSIKRESRPPPRDPSPSPPPPPRSQRNKKPPVAIVDSESDEEEEEPVPSSMRKSARGAPPATRELEKSRGVSLSLRTPAPRPVESDSCDTLLRKGNAVLKGNSPRKKSVRRRSPTSEEESSDDEPEPKIKITKRVSAPERAAATKRKVIEESDEEVVAIDEEPMPLKKAKTKADMRRQMEEATNGQADTGPTKNRGVSLTLKPDPKDLEKRTQIQVRAMLKVLSNKTGSKQLGDLLKKSDEELLKVNMEQAMTVFHTNEILPPIRQLQNDKLVQMNIRQTYKTNEMLANDMVAILKWIHQREDPQPVFTNGNCFAEFRKFADQVLNADYTDEQGGGEEAAEEEHEQMEEEQEAVEEEDDDILVEHPLV